MARGDRPAAQLGRSACGHTEFCIDVILVDNVAKYPDISLVSQRVWSTEVERRHQVEFAAYFSRFQPGRFDSTRRLLLARANAWADGFALAESSFTRNVDRSAI